MKRILLSALLAAAVFAVTAQAQQVPSTTRIEGQHKRLGSMEKNLAQYEANLLKTLDNENPDVQAQAVQTIRDLEQMFPKYPFKSLIEPLGKKLKDENADSIVRTLAALALDELHSDAGDVAISSIAGSSQDKSLQILCKALAVRSQYK
jgi:hypothetical protein